MAEIEKSVAAAVGYRLRGGPLDEQAGMNKTQALADLPQFKQEHLLDDADIAKLDTAIAEVIKGLQDRTTAAGDAHLQTAEQSTALHDLKAERKHLVN
jgi:hypothetical protein